MEGNYLGKYKFTDWRGNSEIVDVYDYPKAWVSKGWMFGDFKRINPKERYPQGIEHLKVKEM